MKKLLVSLVLGAVVAFVLVFSGSFVAAAIPQMINYQGMLTDNSGNPLTDTLNITFKIYNASSGGTLRWQETQSNVPIINGLFNVILGSVNPIDSLTFNEDYWLDITVGAEADAHAPEIRQRGVCLPGTDGRYRLQCNLSA